jgi:hypothetical protein
MRLLGLAICLMILGVLLPTGIEAAPSIVKTTRMRPYTGIGVLLLEPLQKNIAEPAEPLPLYEEPAIARLGNLDLSKMPSNEWIFGNGKSGFPLIVTSKKGVWLRVIYDESGKEAWLKYPSKAKFLLWDSFLKGQSASLLVGLQKKYYQTAQEPGLLTSGTLPGRQAFKVIKVEKDWVMVMLNKDTLTWLRWRDEDGRILIGLEQPKINSLTSQF